MVQILSRRDGNNFVVNLSNISCEMPAGSVNRLISMIAMLLDKDIARTVGLFFACIFVNSSIKS